MTPNGYLQLGLYLIVLLALSKPLGVYMARVYENGPIGLDRVLGPLERLIYRLSGVGPDEEMDWKSYAVAMLLFNFVGLLVVYVLQRLQGLLPLNPQQLGAVSPDSSFNTAVSFATNTNWQGYAGQTTMSYLTQMLGLTVQNFVSAATCCAPRSPRIVFGSPGTVASCWSSRAPNTMARATSSSSPWNSSNSSPP